MAEQTTERDQTERTVLERLTLKGADEPVWVEIGTATGSKVQAVAAVAPNRAGTFRAPSTRSWKGVVEQDEPVSRGKVTND